MKKNKMMRLASVLLVAVVLSTCAISGTFAKYTTSSTASDTARVAYWGFDQAAWAADLDLFDGTYTNVASKNSVNVIAPGTEKAATVKFSYDSTAGTAPEVAYDFSITLDASGSYAALDANTNFVWTLKMPGAENATEYQTVALLKEAIETLNKQYEANALPSGFAAGSDNALTIGWRWNFSANDAGDVADTAMGNADNLDNVTFKLTVTATQVD